MPLPFLLLVGAGIAAAGGVGAGVHGAVKMKNANDTMKSAKEEHEKNIKKFETKNKTTTKSMDVLGTLEIDVLASFQRFSHLLERIQNKPEFRSYQTENVKLPEYNPEEIKKVSVGAGVLMGGLGGAALGTAGGFAAAGATTAAVMALGTASTGAAISSLTGIAATNATLAALGGGALAAGGGGIALGTTVLGATTAGVGLLVGGIIFSIAGKSLSNKADEAWSQMKKAEEKINRICAYLSDLKKTSDGYYQVLKSVDDIYRKHLNELDTVVSVKMKTDWNDFTEQERIITENTVLLVQLLYKMCQVKLVLESGNKDDPNEINSVEIEQSIETANCLIREKEFITTEDKENEKQAIFLMKIEKINKLNYGVIICGAIEKGKIKRGDKVIIKRNGRDNIAAEVKGISKSSQLLAYATTGNVELFFRELKSNDVSEGDMVCCYSSIE